MVSHPDIRIRIGERIRARRQELGLSQVKLAARLGVDPTHVVKYENGKRTPRVENIPLLAEILQVPVNYFFDEVPPKVRACKDSTKSKAKAEA